MIRLCMLARDEAEQIAGVAEAAGDLVDDYCILLDHRTEDDTDEAIVRELGEWGRVIPFRFRDFSHARNQLFEHARQGLKPGDYMLLVDPDSPPRGELPEPLTAPVYECRWEMGGTDYVLPILVRADVDCRYVGACHELLEHGERAELATGMRVRVDAKPPNPERQEWMRELLEADADSPRSAFYLARTLSDLERPAEAAAAYLRRAGMLGWEEETFTCLLEAGRLTQAWDLEGARGLLERARRYRPARLEPIYQLARQANLERRHGAAADLALEGLRLPRSSDRLFVNRWAEREGLAAELALALGELAAAAERLTTLQPEEAPHG